MRIISNPIMLKERTSMLWLQYGNIDVIDGAFVLIDKEGIRTHIPIGGIACLLLEPGIRISHAAVAIAAEVGCLLLWVGEGGVRLYSAGQPGGARSTRLLYQAQLALDEKLRLKVIRAMYKYRFGDEMPSKRSPDQLKGIEGARTKAMYKLLASQYGVKWEGREYDPKSFDTSDTLNLCLSVANHCLYGICEAAILAAGYAPAIGFIHAGKPLSFVYDIADLFKFETSVPLAFATSKQICDSYTRQTRINCRDGFRKLNLLEKIIPTIDEILRAGEIPMPEIHKEAITIAIPNEEQTGDVGHRS